jgi:hypothetical protein
MHMHMQVSFICQRQLETHDVHVPNCLLCGAAELRHANTHNTHSLNAAKFGLKKDTKTCAGWRQNPGTASGELAM